MGGLDQTFPQRPIRIVRHGVSYAWYLWPAPLVLALTLLFFQSTWMFPGPPVDEPGGEVANPYFRAGGCRRTGPIVWCARSVAAYNGAPRPYVSRASSYVLMPFAGGFLLLSAYLVLWTLRSRRDWAVAAAPRRLHLAPAEHVRAQPEMTRRNSAEPIAGTAFYHTYRVMIGGNRRRFISRFPDGEVPLVTAAGGHVAAVPEGARVAVLLDEKLERLELSEAERTAIRTAARARGA